MPAATKTRFAFLGFQHSHIRDAWRRVSERPDAEIVAASEEDAAVREALEREGRVTITHRDHRRLLDTVACDAVVVGERFGKRGSIIAEALRAGRHVLTDKPACTSLSDLDLIGDLAARQRRAVGMMLDLRDAGVFRGLRRLVRDGTIGEVRAAWFGGQHPLLVGSRPAWYHEEGSHGGTINDIAIHGIDLLGWVTGRRFTRVVAARQWQRGVPAGSRFRNAAQLMLVMENECGVTADVSYFSPDSMGYTFPLYWRVTLWGEAGVLETSLTSAAITLFAAGEKTGRDLTADQPDPGGYLASFLREVRGESTGDGLTTADVLWASRVALRAQEAADRNLADVPL